MGFDLSHGKSFIRHSINLIRLKLCLEPHCTGSGKCSRASTHQISLLAAFSMSHISSSSPNDLDFWEFVTCSKCHLPFSSGPSAPPQVPFWLTECGHVICNIHLSKSSSPRRASSNQQEIAL